MYENWNKHYTHKNKKEDMVNTPSSLSSLPSGHGQRKKPVHWHVIKKRGVKNDRLVQMRLKEFVQPFPDLEILRGGGLQVKGWGQNCQQHQTEITDLKNVCKIVKGQSGRTDRQLSGIISRLIQLLTVYNMTCIFYSVANV